MVSLPPISCLGTLDSSSSSSVYNTRLNSWASLELSACLLEPLRMSALWFTGQSSWFGYFRECCCLTCCSHFSMTVAARPLKVESRCLLPSLAVISPCCHPDEMETVGLSVLVKFPGERSSRKSSEDVHGILSWFLLIMPTQRRTFLLRGILHSPTWANFGSWWGVGKPGMLQPQGLHGVGHNLMAGQQQQHSPIFPQQNLEDKLHPMRSQFWFSWIMYDYIRVMWTHQCTRGWNTWALFLVAIN